MKRAAGFVFLLLLNSHSYAQSAWEFVAPMQTARMDAASAVVGDTLYVMGGRQREIGSGTDSEGFVDVVEAYVPSSNSWLVGYPSLPIPAALQASAVLGRRIYLLGGLTEENQTLNCIWHWQPGEPMWTEGASLPIPVEGAAATSLLDDSILLVGGLTAGGEYLDDALIVFPENFGTQYISELNQARAAAGAAPVRDVVMVTGGYFYGPMGECEIFNGLNWGIGPELPHPIGSHLTCVSGSRIFVVGGQGLSGPSSEVMSIYGPHDEWISQESMAVPRARLAGGVLGGFVVAAGGIGSGGSAALNSVERIRLEDLGHSPIERPQPIEPSLTITFWPNPVTTHFSIAAELGVRESWELLLHSPAGRRVWSSSGVSENIRLVSGPLGGLRSGVYVLSLRTTTRKVSTPVTVLE